MDTTQILLLAYREGRLRLENLLPKIEGADLPKSVAPEAASVGWLLTHIAEVEVLFMQRFFGWETDRVHTPHTLGPVRDDRRERDLEGIKEALAYSKTNLLAAIQSKPAEFWGEKASWELFGVITHAQALGRLISHTGYHSGQIALAVKYGPVVG